MYGFVLVKIATKIANHLSEFSRILLTILQIQNIGKILYYNSIKAFCCSILFVCVWLNTIRRINWAQAAKKFVNPDICMNILWVVGFRDIDSEATPGDKKLQVKIVDNHGDDGLLTMHEFSLCHGILDQNRKSIVEAFTVTDWKFSWCVSCLCGTFCNLDCIFCFVVFVFL